ncbi:MAG: cell division protein ZapE [Methylococcaceae bacterium]
MLKKIFKKFTPVTLEQDPDLSGLLEMQYKDRIAKNHIQFDDSQLRVLKRLQTLLDYILELIESERKSVIHKRSSNMAEKCRSLYIFGDVGRGKSMLMALFYEACPIAQKRRVHFNTFMLEVHEFVHQWHQKPQTAGDAISALAKNIRGSVLVLCFDEFHVTDIADAMILGRLFSKLFDLGIIVVITSNRHPNDLYQGGLQREQFLFFIKVLQSKSEIIELVAKGDYRLSHSPLIKTTYYFPLDEHAEEFIQDQYNQLTNFAVVQPGVIQVFGHEIFLTAAHEKIALSSFDDLCMQPLGSADYLAIASEFSTLIMANIPKLTAEKRNEAKRFVTLIDVLYEHKVKLICTAEVSAQALYIEGDGVFEFRRTVSRLIEMQSEGYLQGRYHTHQ